MVELHVNRQSVNCVAVADFSAAVAHGAGAFYFIEGERGSLCIAIVVPGETEPRNLPILLGRKADRHWEWDGNREQPTLSPSISARRADPQMSELWHGFLRAGRLESV